MGSRKRCKSRNGWPRWPELSWTAPHREALNRECLHWNEYPYSLIMNSLHSSPKIAYLFLSLLGVMRWAGQNKLCLFGKENPQERLVPVGQLCQKLSHSLSWRFWNFRRPWKVLKLFSHTSKKDNISFLFAQEQWLLFSFVVRPHAASRFPCCVLSYFSLVFVMEHNWQIQVTRVSWVGQSTIMLRTSSGKLMCYWKSLVYEFG